MSEYCVVTEPCYDCKYTDCVTVCPVDCFYQDEKMLYIDPEECIICSGCIPECPAEAIFENEDVPSQWTHFVELNLEKVEQLRTTGNITQRQEPLLGAGCHSR